MTALKEPPPCLDVKGSALALHVRRTRTTNIRPFEPADAKPAQIFERSVSVHVLAALGIEIFHAHHQRAARIPRALPCRKECARMAHVQIACRRRRKASAIAGRRCWSEAGHAASSVGRRSFSRLWRV